MIEYAKQIGGSAVTTFLVVVVLSAVFDYRTQFGISGPFDPVLESLKTIPTAVFGIAGVVSLLMVYERLTGF